MSYLRLDTSDGDDIESFSHAPRRGARDPSFLRIVSQALSIVFATILLSYAFVTFSLEQASAPSTLEVDLGYAVYRGHPDWQTGLNAWQGIRYAAPPTGDFRWRRPRAPARNRDQIVDADTPAPRCPQSPSSPTPSGYGYQGDEDCLFLSVYAPKDAQKLPVFFYIHGGGYGAGSGEKNVTDITTVNGMGFVSVVIQYRLEAFGFLAGSTVRVDGDLNAGLLDQHFALEWVQRHISKFGGDPRKVTIAGQSAGGGSVEMMALAYGGTESTRYFEQGIASSPYNPVIYQPSDIVPEKNYLRFAEQAGCFTGDPYKPAEPDRGVLKCLRQATTQSLQLANFKVGSGVNFGSWAFVPVVDGTFIRERPSEQLAAGRVNGRRMLISYNADEGAQFVIPDIRTADDFDTWLLSEYPLLTQNDIDQIDRLHYPLTSASDVKLATCGDCRGVDAVSTSPFATGHLQRAMNFYAEVTFDCPSYWLASAYEDLDKAAYLYQFSVPPASHGADLIAEGLYPYKAERDSNIGPDFYNALTTIWGNFIKTGDPSLSALDGGTSSAAAIRWPRFTTEGSNSWQMLNLNQTGGQAALGAPIRHLPPVSLYVGPGLRNDFRMVNASTWEGGRGARCEFLRQIGPRLPV